MKETRSAPKRLRPTNPLGVISLFFGLVEVGLGIGVGSTSGVVQGCILAFMCLFASGIAVTFFVILWKRNWVLYPPADFPGVSVAHYVEAMGGSVALSELAVQGIVQGFDGGRESLKTTDLPSQSRTAVDQIIRDIEAVAIENVKSTVLTIDTRPLKSGGGLKWEMPYDGNMPVQRFLDRVALRLQPFPPHPYGSVWVLREAGSGRCLDDIGMSWAKQNGVVDDLRPIGEAGISGGMTLEVASRDR